MLLIRVMMGRVPRDRDFGFLEFAGPVLDLYHCRWQGQPLWAVEYVMCADVKTSIQVRRRRHPTLPNGPNQATRVEHEYQRGGVLQYLAAWDVHQAVVFGRCEPKTRKAACLPTSREPGCRRRPPLQPSSVSWSSGAWTVGVR